MAKYDSDSAGTLSRSIDNVTAYVSRGLRIMRYKATKVRNPRTDKQKKQRAKMKAVVGVASAFAPIAKVGFPVTAPGKFGYNEFVTANLQAVSVDEYSLGICRHALRRYVARARGKSGRWCIEFGNRDLVAREVEGTTRHVIK